MRKKIIIITLILINLFMLNAFAVSVKDICFNMMNIANENAYQKSLVNNIENKEIVLLQNNLDNEYDIEEIIDSKKIYKKVLPIEYINTVLDNKNTKEIIILLDLSEIFVDENINQNIIKNILLYDQNFGTNINQIGSADEYLENNKENFMDKCNFNEELKLQLLNQLKQIKEKTTENKIKLKVAMLPIYINSLNEENKLILKDLYNELENITEIKNYDNYYITKDSRYFENYLKIKDDVKLTIIKELLDNQNNIIEDKTYEVEIPILLYHHIDENVTSDMVVSPSKFEEDLNYLKENEYTTILLKDLIKYIKEDIELPKKCVCITFDDGYTSNYEYAYPLLKKYGMNATIFVIGSSIGKGVEDNIIPHFNIFQAKEMIKSGVIDIKSHTYDMHQIPSEDSRENILKLNNEKINQYIEYRKNDYIKINKNVFNKLNIDNNILAYPQGRIDNVSAKVSNILGYQMTLTTIPKTNYILKYLPESLYNLNRYNITEDTKLENILY